MTCLIANNLRWRKAFLPWIPNWSAISDVITSSGAYPPFHPRIRKFRSLSSLWNSNGQSYQGPMSQFQFTGLVTAAVNLHLSQVQPQRSFDS
jgi:hypothetical protein